MLKRRRFKQSLPLKDRLAAFAGDMRKLAKYLPPGAMRDEMLLKARRAETAAHIDEWANSPGLQPPR